MEQYKERYEVIKKLGSGATAKVSLVWDTLLLRKVAVKAGTKKQILRQEARNLAAFWTPYFPILYDYAEVGESSLLFLEYIEGESLTERFARIGRYTEAEVLGIACGIARAVESLHTGKEPCIYGDIKPENVMIQSDGGIRLVDFGAVSRIKPPPVREIPDRDQKQIRGGTPFYAPPETWQGRLDERSDIYALGRLMGRLLLMDGRAALSPAMERLFKRCTQKQKNQRYQSMGQFIAEAERLLQSKGK